MLHILTPEEQKTLEAYRTIADARQKVIADPNLRKDGGLVKIAFFCYSRRNESEYLIISLFYEMVQETNGRVEYPKGGAVGATSGSDSKACRACTERQK